MSSSLRPIPRPRPRPRQSLKPKSSSLKPKSSSLKPKSSSPKIYDLYTKEELMSKINKRNKLISLTYDRLNKPALNKIVVTYKKFVCPRKSLDRKKLIKEILKKSKKYSPEELKLKSGRELKALATVMSKNAKCSIKVSDRRETIVKFLLDTDAILKIDSYDKKGRIKK